ncbi:MAG: DinB family protein [Nocardioides sp.]|nr:DinB family protein [Nocardioides sp.]
MVGERGLAGGMAHPGYDGDWLPRDQDPRAEAGPVRGERDTLIGYLEAYRTTLELKCQELTPAQLGTRSVPPSNMSCSGWSATWRASSRAGSGA